MRTGLTANFEGKVKATKFEFIEGIIQTKMNVSCLIHLRSQLFQRCKFLAFRLKKLQKLLLEFGLHFSSGSFAWSSAAQDLSSYF